MFLIVGIWGGRERKILASYKLIIYTIGGSILMLLSILQIYYSNGTCELYIILCTKFSNLRTEIFWFCFFLAFSVKVPLVPFHLWLPEAHVEAPTGGSVILAGMLLKLGTFGIIRYLVGFIPKGINFYQPMIELLAIIGVIYTSLTTLRQIDAKKIIAYSSVGHMSLVILGIIVSNFVGLLGSVAMMLAHGIVSSGLFVAVGVLYERTHTRLIKYFVGCANLMPLLTMSLFILIISNFSIPGSVSFVSEINVLLGIFISSPLIAAICCIGLFLCTGYSLRFFGVAFFQALDTNENSHKTN
jgi:proton-translocating NADH-quinone oxidoreductase chain M